MVSLFDFNSESLKRADISYVKRYLNGQFGAAPIISLEDLVETIQRTVEED